MPSARLNTYWHFQGKFGLMRRIMTKPFDEHRKKVLRLIEDAGKTMIEAATAIDRNRAYIQQYITRAVPQQLHESDRKALASFLGVPENELREPDRHGRRVHATQKSVREPIDYRLPAKDKGPRDMPIRGRAQGGLGVIVAMDQSPTDWVERPSSLMGASDSFGVYVAGDSMAPALPSGATVFVNPAKPPRNGDFVVVEKTNGEAIVKILKSQNGSGYTLGQLNPPKNDIKIAYAEVVGCFKIVTVDYP